jgi:hypothetical protein
MPSYHTKSRYGEEARLALGLTEFLKTAGYSCYPELDRVDLVAKRGSEVIAVECKKSVDLKVFAQAWQHRKKATGVYVAIPGRDLHGSCGWGVPSFVRAMCIQMGIGLFTVTWDYGAEQKWKDWQPGDPIPGARVTQQYLSKPGERTDTSWDRLMVPAGETYSIAGGSGVKAWTETRIWELEVKKWVHENPGQTVGDILRALRPPGVHKKTGKPLVVHKQDQERLFYFIKNVFTDFYTVADGIAFSTSRIFLWDDFAALSKQGALNAV